MKIFLFSILVSQMVLALTPQQYCEKLHQKRPSSVTTTYELLNIEMGPETVVVTGNVIKRDQNFAGAEISGDAAAIFEAKPVIPYANTACYRKGEKPVFTVYSKTSKYCKDGNFRYKKEKVIAPFGSCTVSYTVTATGMSEGDSSIVWGASGAELGVSTFLIETNEP